MAALQKSPEGENQGKSYAEVVGAKPVERMRLSYVAPKMEEGRPVIEIPRRMTQVGKEKWKHTIIAYVLGPAPSFREMTTYVNSAWKRFGQVQVHGMGQGIFILQMGSEEARKEVLEKGPWSLQRRTLILREWEVGMVIDRPAVDRIPVWVRFPKLPLDLWTEEGLSMLSSHIGDPLFADRTTTTQSSLSFARVCVEVKAENVLPNELPVKYEGGGAFVQQVKYEWLPEKCNRCQKFGHKEGNCGAAIVQKYIPVRREDAVTRGSEGSTSKGSVSMPVTPTGMALTPYAPVSQERVVNKTVRMVTPKPGQEAHVGNQFAPLEALEEEEDERESENENEGEMEQMQQLGKGVCEMIAKLVSTSGKKGEKQKGNKKGGRRRLETSLLIEAKPQ